MSTPQEGSTAKEEIIHAMSSLNMYPSTTSLDVDKYISEQLYHVQHAMEHLTAALDRLSGKNNI